MAPLSKDLIPDKISTVRAPYDRKVTVVGANLTGSSCINAILCQRIVGEVCLIDKEAKQVSAEVKDFQHASALFNNVKITGGTDYALSKGSQVILITAGCRIEPGEGKIDPLSRNIALIREIVPKVVEHNKNAILIIATPPCDLTSYLAWKLSGLPKNRVFGTGTALDSTRFSYFLSEKVGVAPSECKGWIIGEHGDRCMPIWSSVNIGGVRLRDIYPSMGKKDDKDDWDRIQQKLVNAPYDIIDAKGAPNWSAAQICATFVNDIFNNTGSIRTISTSATGQYGIEKGVFLSLPCVLTSDGIKNVVKLPLDAEEISRLQEAANAIHKSMCQQKI